MTAGTDTLRQDGYTSTTYKTAYYLYSLDLPNHDHVCDALLALYLSPLLYTLSFLSTHHNSATNTCRKLTMKIKITSVIKHFISMIKFTGT